MNPLQLIIWNIVSRCYSFTIIVGHWDYIHDNETGILVYTWAAGTQPCSDNIHPHRDPHAHIHKESEWTHQGVAFPLDLEGECMFVCPFYRLCINLLLMLVYNIIVLQLMYISFFSLDGVYHITLTALNKVEFGGPMALRICHQTPYIIDTTAPVIHHIEQANFDEDESLISVNVTAE